MNKQLIVLALCFGVIFSIHTQSAMGLDRRGRGRGRGDSDDDDHEEHHPYYMDKERYDKLVEI